MDESDPEISFDEDGVCNHCHASETLARALAQKRAANPWEHVAEEIRTRGKGREYDCLLGVSGGVDSSYVALMARRAGLRLLAVHLDNGWDSELAVQNIERLVERLDVDLVTHVVDWEEFREIQKAYFRAGVVDIEAPTDHAIAALTTRLALKHRIPTVLRGVNHATEATLPRTWRHTKTDRRNLRAIVKQFGDATIETLPTMSTLQLLAATRLRGIRFVDPLDLIEFDKAAAVDELTAAVEWRPYAGKHHESQFTAFYQEVILPRKFGIDKRRAHYSSLISSGQMTREQALSALTEPLTTPEMASERQQFVLKKLGVNEEEFDAWMREPVRSHRDLPSEHSYLDPLVTLVQKRRL
jgi:N-acetyl sugar amidotransferase